MKIIFRYLNRPGSQLGSLLIEKQPKGKKMASTTYKTKQKTRIMEVLMAHEGRHMTASEVYEELRASGEKIGLTTVYRSLDRLVESGSVRKYTIPDSKSACFEYTRDGSDVPAGEYHCKCLGCGKLIHIHCDQVADLEKHMSEEHGFSIDPGRTVFYGLCSACRERGGKADGK